MNFLIEADIAKKVISVLESCTMKRHMHMAGKYKDMSLRKVNDVRIRIEIIDAFYDTKNRISNKPRYRFSGGEWVKVENEKQSNYSLAKLQRESLANRFQNNMFCQGMDINHNMLIGL